MSVVYYRIYHKKHLTMSSTTLPTILPTVLEESKELKEPTDALTEVENLSSSAALFWASSEIGHSTTTEKFFLFLLIYYSSEAQGAKKNRTFMNFPIEYLSRLVKQIATNGEITPKSLHTWMENARRDYRQLLHLTNIPLDMLLRLALERIAEGERRNARAEKIKHDRITASELYESAKLFMMHKKWAAALENLKNYKAIVDAEGETGKNPADDKHLLYLSMCHHNALLEGALPEQDGLVTAAPNVYIDQFVDWCLKYPPTERLKLPPYVAHGFKSRNVAF